MVCTTHTHTHTEDEWVEVVLKSDLKEGGGISHPGLDLFGWGRGGSVQ